MNLIDLKTKLFGHDKNITANPHTPKQLKRALDRVMSFSVIVRDGMKCVTCGVRKDLTASHVLRRGHENAKWEEKNIFAQCYRCNGYHNRNAGPLTAVFLKQYGADEYQRLVDQHSGMSHFKAHHYSSMLSERLAVLATRLDAHNLTVAQVNAVRYHPKNF